MRNYVPHLDAGRDHDHHQHSEDSCYLCQALPAGAANDGIIEHEAPDVEADMEGDMGCGEYIDYELHHLPKRADCYACPQAKMKMKPARRRDPALKERPAAWGHTLLGHHISAADLDLERVDLKLGITLLDAGTLFGDLKIRTARAGSSRSSLTCYAILTYILYPSMVALRAHRQERHPAVQALADRNLERFARRRAEELLLRQDP